MSMPAAQVLWTVLLHISSLVHLLPDGEKVDPQTHALPDLPAGATISDNWGNPAAFIQMTISIDGPSIGDSITTATLSTLLQRLLDETDPDGCYGGLQGGSPLQAPRMPVHDLTAAQAAFWWAHGFFLALWCVATGQAPLPLSPFQLDKWTASLINSVCPDIGLFLRAWLDLEKSQPLSTHERPDQCYLEPVLVFLNDHCDGIITAHQLGLGLWHSSELHEHVDRSIQARHLVGHENFNALPAFQKYHAGFHQSFGSSFNQSLRSPSLPSLISTVCLLTLRSDQEFAYWFFNNKLETLDQLKDIIWYDITSIKDTELGKRVAWSIEGTFVELVRHRFQVALENYLSKDLIRRGTQMLQTVTASPYLPPNSWDKIQIIFVEPEPNKNFHQYIHACFLAIDISFDCPLALMLANGHWNEITLEAYFDGLFMGDHTVFNRE
ncbi:uncharacterized protein ARMOST_10185 [Armillaria ostoyae]|uniref:Uncharacterized protein n=1 Tax=Armillaria ostoyae TaxID=47428 RepID=A0A284RDL1_ARMOS|nr:uncharacterized protein ARMOST_10185 [Armillaria ostoyae]